MGIVPWSLTTTAGKMTPLEWCAARTAQSPELPSHLPPNLTPAAACAADVVVSDQGVAVVCVRHRQVVH